MGRHLQGKEDLEGSFSFLLFFQGDKAFKPSGYRLASTLDRSHKYWAPRGSSFVCFIFARHLRAKLHHRMPGRLGRSPVNPIYSF